MSYTPVVPLSGYAGWTFLQRTLDAQQKAFNQSATVQRDIDYFNENITKVDSAEGLVSDYRLLKVALGAFGLQDEIGSKYFIQKILSEGVENGDSLANKLSDKSFYKFAQAFSFVSENAAAPERNDFADELNLTIDGDGYLQVELDSGETAYTRNATLMRDSDGRIVTSGGNAIIPEIVIRDVFTSISVDSDGTIRGTCEPGGPAQRLGQITLSTFEDESALGLTETGLFTETEASGEPMTGSPGDLGFGRILQSEMVAAESAFDFASITAAYQTRSFEVAVGEQNSSMRLALNLDRELSELAAKDVSDAAQWYNVMGSEPLREVFDSAFGLSDAFATLDVDRQLEIYRDKADAYFGNSELSQFTDEEKRTELIRLFLVRSEIGGGNAGMSSAQMALTLLSG